MKATRFYLHCTLELRFSSKSNEGVLNDATPIATSITIPIAYNRKSRAKIFPLTKLIFASVEGAILFLKSLLSFSNERGSDGMIKEKVTGERKRK